MREPTDLELIGIAWVRDPDIRYLYGTIVGDQLPSSYKGYLLRNREWLTKIWRDEQLTSYKDCTKCLVKHTEHYDGACKNCEAIKNRQAWEKIEAENRRLANESWRKPDPAPTWRERERDEYYARQKADYEKYGMSSYEREQRNKADREYWPSPYH